MILRAASVRRVVAGALVVATCTGHAIADSRVRPGQPAPGFSLPLLAKGQRSLSELRGKVVLIDFWAEWCDPCKRELPQLQKLADEFSARGAQVVSVNIDKEREHAARVVRELGISFEVLLDPKGTVAAQYDLPKMPTSFLLDRQGVVRYVHEGFDGSRDVARFRRELTVLTR